MPETQSNTIDIPSASAKESFIFFGTQGVGPGKGISVARFNSLTGEMTKPELAAETNAPAFFAIHPNGRYLYACNSNNFACGWFSETISAFSIDPHNGRLSLINQQQSGGRDPNYLYFDESARHILVANYKGGNISALVINSDGSLGRTTAFFQHDGKSIDPERQTQSNAHCIKLDPENRFALVADLGVDRIFIYRFDKEEGTLQPNDPPYKNVTPGYGPRHLVFRPDKRFIYLTNETAGSISVFAWDGIHGVLTEIQTVSIPTEGFEGVILCGDIIVHPNGKILYAANRGQDSVSVFSIDESSGKIDFVENVSTYGQKPRNIVIDPTCRWFIVSNQISNNVMIYSIDPANGRLTPREKPVEVPNPMYIGFLTRNW